MGSLVEGAAGTEGESSWGVGVGLLWAGEGGVAWEREPEPGATDRGW